MERMKNHNGAGYEMQGSRRGRPVSNTRVPHGYVSALYRERMNVANASRSWWVQAGEL